jgi:hypothetical protein
MFIKLTNDAPETYTIGQLRRDNPQISFPRDIPADVLAEFYVYNVKQTPAPEIDNRTHSHTQTVELVDNIWAQVWQTVQLPLEQAEANIRAHRDYLLQDSDWIVSRSYERGEPVPADWAAYRQSLRDVTLQNGFPYAVIWPTKE